MPGTFSYTESTNRVVVTGGTSGSPADFASFVTADRAGVDTILLSAGSPASNLALTYAVRPVEDLAILVKCVVANKTAEADFIFITGTDWRGAAQTESIDITAGNGSYTSTKYWSEITILDCSDNANGGGTVWADGDLTVTQDVWGVIWDYGGRYKIDCIFDVGDGGTSTYLKTTQEIIIFTRKVNIVKANATFHCGTKTDNDNTNQGSIILFDSENIQHYTRVLNINTGTFYFYDSLMMPINVAGPGVGIFKTFGGCNTEILNSSFSDIYFEFAGGTHSWKHIRMADCNPRFDAGNTFSLFEDVTINTPGGYYFYITTNGASQTLVELKCYGTPTNGLSIGPRWNGDIILIDCELDLWTIHNADTAWQNSDLLRKYTCNIHVADKDGANLAGVLVACEDTNGDAAFTTQTTAADGTITEQNITYQMSEYTGGAEVLTTYSPHKFTLSKAGYKTLVLDNITVDGPIDWHLELQDPAAGGGSYLRRR